MFNFMFGWSKASECKKAIEKARCRLNELKQKRCWIVKHMRNDVEKLIKLGQSETALERVDQVYKDEGMVVVYELLALFCEHISFHLSRISRKWKCPKEVIEAVSSLMFASARCKDVPELLHIRRLFTSRYGKSFKTKALSGNRVNVQIIEKLSIEKVSDEVKCKLLEEISENVTVDSLDSVSDVESSSDSSDIDDYDDVQEFKPMSNKGSNQRGFLFMSSPFLYEDIQEFKSPLNKDSDQRGFLFVSPPLSGDEKTMER